jgi:hypothetical protein
MKKLIAVAFIALMSTGVMAQTKCVPDGRGGLCCWDVGTQGPWKPIGC